ncbi:MAG: hypothetical protein DME65_02060 [Verrucomicrobia bacterium]|nr:MAG: hypothetical protein DME65_02060 [Verrucomicrobiota bacterium]
MKPGPAAQPAAQTDANQKSDSEVEESGVKPANTAGSGNSPASQPPESAPEIRKAIPVHPQDKKPVEIRRAIPVKALDQEGDDQTVLKSPTPQPNDADE